MNKTKIKNMIIEALITDGSHHKQYFLEELLKDFVIDFERYKNKYQWEEGIAP